MNGPILSEHIPHGAACPTNSRASRRTSRVVSFRAGQVIQSPGEPLRDIWFLDRSLCSLTMTTADGSTAEVATSARKALWASRRFSASARSSTMRPCTSWATAWRSVMNVEVFHRELDRREVFYAHALEYVETFVGGIGRVGRVQRAALGRRAMRSMAPGGGDASREP